jgi:hypothetical protein
MSALSGFFSRLRAVFTKRALDADFDAELAGGIMPDNVE